MADYVKNKELLLQIKASFDASTCLPELIDSFYLIAERLSHKYIIKREEDRQDYIQQGVIDAYQYFWNFNSEKSSNAFSYVTQIIKNGMNKANRSIYKAYFAIEGYSQSSISTNKIYNL